MSHERYIGRDRRQPVPSLVHRVVSRRLRLVVPVAAVLWVVLALLISQLPALMANEAIGVVRGLSAALFLAAGGLRIARWRLTGEARVAWNGVALLVLGVGLPVVQALGRVMHQNPTVAVVSPAARGLMTLCVLAAMVASLRSAEVVAGLRPVRVAMILLGCLGLSLAVLFKLHGSAVMTSPSTSLWVLTEISSAVGWSALGCWAWRLGRDNGRHTGQWSAVGLQLMAVAELLRAGALADVEPAFSIAAGFQLMAAALAVLSAAFELWEAFFFHGSRLLHLAGDLEETSRTLDLTRLDQQERLHDARSVVLGVLGASHVLANPSEDDATTSRLGELMAAELSRLEQVLDPASLQEPHEVRLADAFEPVLATHRHQGGVVDASLGSVLAFARPAVLATALANLLDNARKHAPGARVTVEADVAWPNVVVTVTDDGPGIPAAELGTLLERGVRGSTAGASGSGLGLYNAAQTLAGEGGSLRVESVVGRGTRAVITVPATSGRLALVLPEPRRAAERVG